MQDPDSDPDLGFDFFLPSDLGSGSLFRIINRITDHSRILGSGGLIGSQDPMADHMIRVSLLLDTFEVIFGI